jgi:hypothetical protein
VGRTERAWRWCRRNPALAGLAGLLVVLTVGLVAVLWNRPAVPPREPAQGERIRVGESGAWKGAVAAAALGGRIYTVENDNRVYETDPGTGGRRPLGAEVFAGTRRLLAGDGLLYVVGPDGSLAAVNPADGSSRVVGPAPDWETTVAGVFLDGDLYTAEDYSKLWETDLAGGRRRAVGKPEFVSTRLLAAGGDTLYGIKDDGLFAFRPADGTWKRLGPTVWWGGSVAATVLKDRLYTIDLDWRSGEKRGVLYATDLASGKYEPVGQPEFSTTDFLVTAGDKLYCLDWDGSLYAVNPADGTWRSVGTRGAAGAAAVAVLKGRLYTIELFSSGGKNQGLLYERDLTSGKQKAVGGPDFGNTRLGFLFAAGDALYSVEKDGTLYAINPADGTWKQVGPQGGWLWSEAGTVWKGRLYTTDHERRLVRTDPASGRRTAVLNDLGGVSAAYLFAADDGLYALGKDGGVYRLNTAGGPAEAVRQEGDLKEVQAAAVVGSRLYTVEGDKNLHETDLAGGNRKQLGESEFGATRRLLACGGHLYALDGDGSLYRIQRK